MLDGYFSKRHNLRPKSHGFIYEYVPESARVGLYQILEKYFQDGLISSNQLYANISHVLDLPQENAYRKIVNVPRDTRKAIRNSIMECEWWQFYDVCEVIFRSINPYCQDVAKADFHEKANTLFKSEKLGFEINNEGIVEKIDASFTDGAIQKARYLIKDPEFQEANEHFEKALKELDAKTSLDGENFINDILSALETVARRINSDNDMKASSLSDFIEDLIEKGNIPRPIGRAIRAIYSLTVDYQKITGGISGPTNLGIDEAEFMLATTASLITYLVNKSYQPIPAQDPKTHVFTNFLKTLQS